MSKSRKYFSRLKVMEDIKSGGPTGIIQFKMLTGNSAHFVFYVLSVCLSHLANGNQEQINQQLLARIEALEMQGTLQNAHIEELEYQLGKQNQCTESQMTEVTQLKSQIRKQDLQIQHLQTNNLDLANVISQSKNKLVTSLLKGKSRESRLVLDTSENIVFNAHIDMQSLDNIAVNQTIVFDTVDTNLGGGYNKQSGIFTAPRPGIYLLSTSFASYLQHHHEVHLAMLKNGQVLARAVAHGDSGHLDQGSTMVVTPLNKGDMVWLTNIGDPASSVGGNTYSNFLGIALFEM